MATSLPVVKWPSTVKLSYGLVQVEKQIRDLRTPRQVGSYNPLRAGA